MVQWKVRIVQRRKYMVTTDGKKVVADRKNGTTEEHNGATEEEEWHNGR